MGQVRELRRRLGGGGGGEEPPPWEGAPEPPDLGKLPEWAAELDTDKKGNIENTFGNAVVILQRSDEWRGLRFNEFRQEPVIVGAPEVPLFDKPKDGPVDDYSIAHIWQWLALRWKVRIGVSVLETAVVVASKAKGRAFHPVRDYLRGLEWDGVRRIDQWLVTYAGAQDSEYVRSIGRMLMIAAVARVMQKMSICKTMIILEGDQDAGKSTLLRRLCPNDDWFSDTPVDLGKTGPDRYQVLRGKWIIEIPELDGFRGKDARSIKSFVSSAVDNYRASFGRRNQDVPRQCIFAGSTNENHYFHDSTGNVRFWPVRVGNAIDFVGIERDRDQLWAEALSYYQDGAAWHITDANIKAQAKAEQEEREEEDVWTGKFRSWLMSPLGSADARKGVTTGHVLTDAIGLGARDQDRPEQTRIGIIMRKFGFERVPGSKDPRKYWLKEGDSDDE